MTAHIFIIDAEKRLTVSMKSMLAESNYRATACHEIKAAKTYYTKNWQNIDLVVLDYHIQGGCGYDTMLDFILLNPYARIVLMADPDLDVCMSDYMGGSKGVLKKPFKNEDLLSCVKRALEEKSE